MRKTCLLVALTAGLLGAANPMPDEFSHQFRNGVAENPTLRLSGPSAKQVAKADAQGLRITLSGKRADKSGSISVAPSFAMHGDCEVTLGFDLLGTEDPLDKQGGAGIVLTVKVGTDGRAVAVSRLRRPGAAGQPPVDTFGGSLITRGADGKDKYDTKSIPTAAKSGRLRLAREGEVVRISVSEDAKGEFQTLREVPVGREDLHSLTAQCRAKSGGVDARFTELTIRAESLVNQPTKTSKAGWNWVPWAAGAAVLVVGAGVVLVLRRRRGADEEAPADTGATEGAAPRKGSADAHG